MLSIIAIFRSLPCLMLVCDAESELAGVEMWNFPVFEGCKRFSELVDSPMHGFNFCCGTASEGLRDPGVELCPIVKYFAVRTNDNLCLPPAAYADPVVNSVPPWSPSPPALLITAWDCNLKFTGLTQNLGQL